MRVRIYQPAKNAMQSGRGKNNIWLIEPELASARTPEALMGWTSAEDTLGELMNCLRFDCADDALAFARKNGWEFQIDQPAQRRITPRNYLDNFRAVRPQDEDRKAGG